jgi:hypothetical protein
MCCSGKRTTMRSSGAFRPEANASHVNVATTQVGRGFPVFQNIGGRPLTVRGPVSGKQYRFFAQGTTAAVDPRDRVSLARIPHIREVKR